MRKKFRNIIFLLILVALFVGLAPRFLILDQVQQTITDQISINIDSSVSTEKMRWVWLPLPHLTLVNTTITNVRYDLTVPKARIYLGWDIFLGKVQPGKIVLDHPDIHIRNKTFQSEGLSSGPVMPAVALIVKKGTLQVDAADEYKDVLLADALTFSSVSGKVKLMPQAAEIAVQASAPFSREISLQGNYNLAQKKYRFQVNCQDLQLQKIVTGYFGGRLVPAAPAPEINVTVTGRQPQQFEAELRGTLPDFTVKQQERVISLALGGADLKLSKSGPLMRLDINRLEVKDPRLNLSGFLERNMPAVSGTEQPPPEPVWTLNFTGTALDLTAIRGKVLALWPDNAVAQHVTNAVRDGEARSAAYRFSGRTEDFNNLDNMVIEADVLHAAIHVPEAELDLTEASGPIQIKNSTLSGHGLRARLGNSYGHDADLLLELVSHHKAFELTIDIDADLADLPPVLARVVHHQDFQQELKKFSGVAGKASGTLHLGDRLDHVITRVDVKSMQAAFRYDPIPQPVLVDSGGLQVAPEKVSWQHVKGRIGQQQITATSGNVSWLGGEILLHIEKMLAHLQGAQLLAMLQQKNVFPHKIQQMLSSLQGTLEVTAGSLQGPARDPAAWEYTVAFTTPGLTITSPLLPEPMVVTDLTGVLNQDAVDFQESTIQYLDQELDLEAHLKHHLLEDWHGTIVYNGPLEARLADWISYKGWFPENLRPRIPCTMKNLLVSWQGDTVGVTGSILHGLDGGRLPMARIDFTKTPEHLHVKELAIYAPGEQGRLKLEFWRISPFILNLSWEGIVNATTVNTLFEYSTFSKGNFSGAFTVTYNTDRLEATRFDGLLQTENLYLKTEGRAEPIFIKKLDVKGLGKQLRIPALELAIGSEMITGSGQLAAEKEGLQLDFSLASPFLANQSLSRLSLAMQKTLKTLGVADAARAPSLEIIGIREITGRIGFDFDSFVFSHSTRTPYDTTQKTVKYTFHDLHGEVQLAPDNISRTEIFSSKLCGLDFRGIWFSDPGLEQKFVLDTDPHKTMHLEKVLPCLGVQQDIIEGEFTLHAELLKEANIWHGGNIYVKSSQGRILRLQTLSKIFKVVNITDLFEKHIGNAGRKGFPFSQMDIDTHIEDNNLIIDRAIIQGEGLNLFAQGKMHMDDYDADLTLLIAPFKTLDAIISKVPIIGKSVVGESGSRVSIPVAIKGPIADPSITPLHPGAISETLLNLVKDTFMLPYNILKPLEKSGAKNSTPDSGQKQQKDAQTGAE